jgi:hypothetical protein
MGGNGGQHSSSDKIQMELKDGWRMTRFSCNSEYVSSPKRSKQALILEPFNNSYCSAETKNLK